MTGDEQAAVRRQVRAARLRDLAAPAAPERAPTPDPHPGHEDEPVARTEGPAHGALPALPPGHVYIAAETLAALRRDADAPQQIAAERARAEREALVDTAIDDGRIPPYRRQGWLALLKADPHAAAELAAIPRGASGIPLGPEIGHAGNSEFAEPSAWF